MILGIAASITDDIKINLDFYDDSSNDPAKKVCIEKNNIYNITYEKNNTIYESKCKIVNITTLKNGEYDRGIGFVRQYVGMYDSVYYTKECFMKLPPVVNLILVVDTSDTFEGRYEYIELNTIRDCDIISDVNSHSITFELEGKKVMVNEDGSVIITTDNGTVETNIESLTENIT